MAKQNWNSPFSAPIYPKDGDPINTLADARAYMLALPESVTAQNQWQRAAERLMMAAEGRGSVATAREALHSALFLSMRLGFREKQ